MGKLYEDSLRLTINKSLSDIRLLLMWAEEATEIKDKIQHTEESLRLLAAVVENLRELR